MTQRLYPPEALASHIAILGKTGSGKSNAAKVIVERLLLHRQRVAVLDPTGTWWGLRLAPDGTQPSRFKPIIFGGAHGDIALSEQHGAVLAEAVGRSSDSVIVDTQQMTVGQRTRFATAFGDALLRANGGALTLVIDEAHLFAPQGRVNDPASGQMLHAFNNLVSLGRSRGLRIILISQRPAKLHKDALTQVETLVAMRLLAPQDTAAVKAWVGDWADTGKGAEIVGSLPSLQTGDAWVWMPQADFLERVHFPLAATFDSGTAEANAAARTLPPIDLSKVAARMDAIRQDAAENDPRQLKARIAELERAAKQAPAPVDPKAIDEAYQRGILEGEVRGQKSGAALTLARVDNLLHGLRVDDIVRGTADATPAARREVRVRRTAEAAPPPVPASTEPRRTPAPANEAAGTFTGPQVKILRALALWKSLGNSAPSKPQIAFVAGYSPTSSTFTNILGMLRSAGAIDYPASNCATALVDGFDMDRAEATAAFASRLSGPQRKVVDALKGEAGLGKTELAARIGYSPTSSTFTNILGSMRSLGLIDYPQPGQVELKGWVNDLL